MKYKCPCCNYLTLEDNPKDPTFEICPVCFWENDPIHVDKPDSFIGPNRVTLNQGKINFNKFGACEEHLIEFVRKPLPEEIDKDINN